MMILLLKKMLILMSNYHFNDQGAITQHTVTNATTITKNVLLGVAPTLRYRGDTVTQSAFTVAEVANSLRNRHSAGETNADIQQKKRKTTTGSNCYVDVCFYIYATGEGKCERRECLIQAYFPYTFFFYSFDNTKQIYRQ